MHTVPCRSRQVMAGTRAERRATQEQQKRAKALGKLRSDPQGFTTFLIIRHGETDWNKEHRLQGHTDVELNQSGRLQALQVAEYLANKQKQTATAQQCNTRSRDDQASVITTLDGHDSNSSAFDGQPVTAIYSSDLARAAQTADAVGDALKLPVQTTSQLRERHLGILQGLTRREAAEKHPEAWAAKQNHQVQLHNSQASHEVAVGNPCSQMLHMEDQQSEEPRSNTVSPTESNGATDGTSHGIETLQELCRRVVTEVERIAALHLGQTIILVTHGGVIQALHLKATGHPASSPAANCRIYKLAVGCKAWAVIDWSGDGPASANLSDGFGGGIGGG